MKCPKCARELPNGLDSCPHCGIIFSKYEQYQKKKAEPKLVTSKSKRSLITPKPVIAFTSIIFCVAIGFLLYYHLPFSVSFFSQYNKTSSVNIIEKPNKDKQSIEDHIRNPVVPLHSNERADKKDKKVVVIDESHEKIKSFSNTVSHARKGVVTVLAYDENGRKLGLGSGFFVNNKGHFVTNYHVLAGSQASKIKTFSGKLYSVNFVLHESKNKDLLVASALVPESEVVPIPIYNGYPELAEEVLVIGSPIGLEQTVTNGIVSSIRELENMGSVVQISAAISHGSSGSPVINIDGEAIGIAFMKIVGGENLNFAIPGNALLDLLEGNPKFADYSSWASNNPAQPKLASNKKKPNSSSSEKEYFDKVSSISKKIVSMKKNLDELNREVKNKINEIHSLATRAKQNVIKEHNELRKRAIQEINNIESSIERIRIEKATYLNSFEESTNTYNADYYLDQVNRCDAEIASLIANINSINQIVEDNEKKIKDNHKLIDKECKANIAKLNNRMESEIERRQKSVQSALNEMDYYLMKIQEYRYHNKDILSASSQQISKLSQTDSSDNFVKFQGNIVFDKETGLMWAAENNGYDIGWREAAIYCFNCSCGDFHDWRMPTVDELRTLHINYSEKDGCYINRLIDVDLCCHWAGDENEKRAALVTFRRGADENWFDKVDYKARVLPVRGGAN